MSPIPSTGAAGGPADGAVFVAIKPICEGLGIDWEAQRKRIQRDQVLAEGASIMEVPSKGGLEETVTLRLDLVNGWLFGVGANQVKPEARPKVCRHLRRVHQQSRRV